MIRINDDWVVDVDQYSYTLKRDAHRKRVVKKKTEKVEENVYITVGHYLSLDRALDRIFEEMVRQKVMMPKIDLKTAITAIRECRDEWQRLVDEVRLKENE